MTPEITVVPSEFLFPMDADNPQDFEKLRPALPEISSPPQWSKRLRGYSPEDSELLDSPLFKHGEILTKKRKEGECSKKGGDSFSASTEVVLTIVAPKTTPSQHVPDTTEEATVNTINIPVAATWESENFGIPVVPFERKSDDYASQFVVALPPRVRSSSAPQIVIDDESERFTHLMLHLRKGKSIPKSFCQSETRVSDEGSESDNSSDEDFDANRKSDSGPGAYDLIDEYEPDEDSIDPAPHAPAKDTVDNTTKDDTVWNF